MPEMTRTGNLGCQSNKSQEACSLMTVELLLRLIAGGVGLVSSRWLWVHPYFYFLTAFVGLNLTQSGFSNCCPMMTFLRKAGVRDR